MKKSLRLAAVLLAAATSTAALADGFYVQGDLGLAHLKNSSSQWNSVSQSYANIKNSYKESGFMPRISAGYDFGNVRVAGDYTHYKNAKQQTAAAHISQRAQSVGVSAIYDIPVDFPVKPYVGARVGLNHIKQEASAPGYSHSEKSVKLGLGAMVGAGYQINKQLTLDTGYRFNHLDAGSNTHEASVGLRYSFK